MKIIAELCQNHGGNYGTLARMTESAAEAGATHVKVQHIYVKNLVWRPQFEEGLTVKGNIRALHRPWEAEYARLKPLELSDADVRKFVDLARSFGLQPMTTCFARGDLPRIVDQGFDCVKIASYDCASFQLLREVGDAVKYVVVSTGATRNDEVEFASQILRESGVEFSLLHCVTRYPTPLNDLRLERIAYLRKFADEVGFSDHSACAASPYLASLAASCAGAEWIERHFTVLDREATKDGPVSINGDELKRLVQMLAWTRDDQLAYLQAESENWGEMLGEANAAMTDDEMLNRDYYRGRFATPLFAGARRSTEMIFNWEEVPL